MTADAPPFWRTKSLAQMTRAEWESLCDRCGQCCLHKLGGGGAPVERTTVACRLLDTGTSRCTNYAGRRALVPDCVVLTPDNVAALMWLPDTCAYRLVAAGKDLPDWHPLVSDDPDGVHRAGVSVHGRCISERDAGPLENYLVAPVS